MSINLPDINAKLKPYIYDFFRSNRDSGVPYEVEVLKQNKLRVVVPNTKHGYAILMFFDSMDRVRTAIQTDDPAFYTSLFYIEVLRKRRDNEAWTAIKGRFPQRRWIERYIHFLVRAPGTTETYWDLLTQDKEPRKCNQKISTDFSV